MDAERDSPAGSLTQGTVVGDSLRIVGLIGVGGMGEVYEVEQLRLGRRFALKVLQQGMASDAKQRFRREARAIAGLDDEHIVSSVDCGELPDGRPYLVMERLQGRSLRTLLQEYGPLPVTRAVALIEQVCSGVAAAHRAGIVHRDLKPENVFVRQHESHESCKILDFGVAKLAGSDVTRQGTLLGTVKYMPPEQVTDSASVGPEADVYAIGAILYECLAGTPPHVAESEHALMFKILHETPRSLAELCAGVPEALANVVDRALAREPERRYASAAELRSALSPFGRPGLAHRSNVADTTQHEAPRTPTRLFPRARGGLALALFASLGVGFFAGQSSTHRADAGNSASASAATPPPWPPTAPLANTATVSPPRPTAEPASPVASTPPFTPPVPVTAPATARTALARTQGDSRPAKPPKVSENYDRNNPYAR